MLGSNLLWPAQLLTEFIMDQDFPTAWKSLLGEEFQKLYWKELAAFVALERQKQTVYPPEGEVFNAFQHCAPADLKVVIIGQDPYHGEGQANGLAFSVHEDMRIPPSLKNIFKEIQAETGKEIPANGNLERWADQGVLLLNATLTVRAKQPASHQKKGWETFTDEVIRKISGEKEGVVFMLWGAYARQKAELIDRSKHLILESAHPSPFSARRGFFGNDHFIKANEYLKAKGKETIEW